MMTTCRIPPGRPAAPRAMPPDPAPEDPAPAEAPPRPPVLTSAELMRGAREVTILHGGEAYRLRITSKDRLILTK